MHSPNHDLFIRAALEQAQQSYDEGGLPIGAIMTVDNTIISAGHNRRGQEGDPIAHGEMDCMRRAGRRRSRGCRRTFAGRRRLLQLLLRSRTR